MIEEVRTKSRQAIAKQGYDAVIAVGVDNVSYLSGCVLPFAQNYPDRKAVLVQTREGEASLVCPFDWAQAVVDQGWDATLKVYDEGAGAPPSAVVRSLAAVLSQYGCAMGKVGIDTSRTSKRFMDVLASSLPGVDCLSCDGMYRDLRITKTRDEIQLLEAAAKHTDRGIIGALNHVEGAVDNPGYTVSELAERVRVHVMEFGGSGIGHLAVRQGADTRQYYAPHRGTCAQGSLVRIDVTNHYRGYWSNGGRMVVMGEPTREQEEAYGENMVLHEAGRKALRPGRRCSEVFHEVGRLAEESGVQLFDKSGIGHGVGASYREAPHLSSDDMTVLAPGMVLVLDINTYGPSGELIHSKDTYEIAEGGARLLSWYKSWHRLYAVTGFRAAH